MKILIAVDGSEFSKEAVLQACQFVGKGKNEVKIVTAYVDQPVATEAYGITVEYHHLALDAVRRQAADHLLEAAGILRTRLAGSDVTITTEILCGYPDREIVEEAKRWKADLIVVGSHGQGFWGRMLGSVSTGVLHHAPCSVLVVRRNDNV